MIDVLVPSSITVVIIDVLVPLSTVVTIDVLLLSFPNNWDDDFVFFKCPL